MTDKRRRRVTGAAAAGLATALCLTVVPPTANAAGSAPGAAPVPTVTSPVPHSEWCARPLSRLELYRSSSRFDPPSTLTLLGETKSIDLDTFTLGQVPFADVSRKLWYRSLLWLGIAATDFHERGLPDLAEQMAVPMIRAAEAYPDPGSSTPQLLALSNAIGWDEGTTFRRAEALMCLSEYTGVRRIRPLLRMHADALVDPNRYKGPPQRPVHNHGMLANLVLLDLSRRLNDPEYRRIAISRLINDADQVFSPAGWAYEGSTLYQSVNIAGWRDVSDALRQRGYTAEADAIDVRLARGSEVVAQLVGPTGQLAAIGNTRLYDTVKRPDPNPSRPLTLTDPVGGIAAGRWSWTDTQTTWWTALNQPRTGAHGHDDNLSLTWQTLGVPTVIDIGQYDYDRANEFTRWMSRAVAHNRAIPNVTSANEAKVRSLTTKRKGSLDKIVMTSSDKGPQQRREVLIDDKHHSMEVTDTAADRLTQYWHLAPGWTQSETTDDSIRFRGPSGRVLQVTTSPGAVIEAIPSSFDPLAGLVATGFKQVVAAPEFRVSSDSSISTTFQMYASAKAIRELPALTLTPKAMNRKVRVTWDWLDPSAAKPNGDKPKLTEREKAAKRAIRSVRGYRIQVRSPLFGWLTLDDDNGSGKKMSTKLRRLTNGETYEFRVAPLTKRGQAPYSESVEAVPVSVPGKPTAPVVEPAPGRASRLSWEPPLEDGGAKVRRYTVSIGRDVTKVRRASVRLSRLGPGRATILVRAENEHGSSKPLRVRVVVKRDGSVKLG